MACMFGVVGACRFLGRGLLYLVVCVAWKDGVGGGRLVEAAVDGEVESVWCVLGD